MKNFNGKILFLDRSDINTDEIIPAKYLTELTKAGDYIRSRTYSAFTPYIVSGLLYLFVVLTLTWLIGKLERRLRNSDH